METDRITLLIFQYYTNSLTEEKSKELQRWLDANPHHRELMNKILDKKDYVRRYTVSEQFNESAAWNKLQNNIISNKKTDKKNKSFKYWYYYATAAAIVLVLLVIGYKNWFSSTQSEGFLPVSASQAQIYPSDEGVILYYGNKKDIIKNKIYSFADSIIYMTNITDIAIENYIIEVPKGNTFTLNLDDGSTIYLNSDSKMRLPRKFHHNLREVELYYGEAYFKIARDTLRPFVVNTGRQRVSVLGTSFAIKAYQDEPEIQTTLVSGKVNVKTEEAERILCPGFQSVCTPHKLNVRKVDVPLYTAWQKETLVFKNESLGSIMKTLVRWYNLEVIYESENLKNIHFTGELKRYQAVNKFLEKIEYLKKVRFLIKDRTVLVSTYN